MDSLNAFLKYLATTTLASHRHDTVVMTGSLDGHLSLPGRVTAGLFDVDMLVVITTQNSCWSVPVIWRSNHEDIQALVFQHFSDVTERVGDPLLQALHGGLSLCNSPRVDIANCGDFTIVLLSKSSSQRASTSIDTHHSHHQGLIRRGGCGLGSNGGRRSQGRPCGNRRFEKKTT